MASVLRFEGAKAQGMKPVKGPPEAPVAFGWASW